MKSNRPRFETEAEEAEWWDSHAEEIESDLLHAMERGELKTLPAASLVRRLGSKTSSELTIHLAQSDLILAGQLAHAQGVDLSTLFADLLHQALERTSQPTQQTP